jgi:hypothetical protein
VCVCAFGAFRVFRVPHSFALALPSLCSTRAHVFALVLRFTTFEDVDLRFAPASAFRSHTYIYMLHPPSACRRNIYIYIYIYFVLFFHAVVISARTHLRPAEGFCHGVVSDRTHLRPAEGRCQHGEGRCQHGGRPH